MNKFDLNRIRDLVTEAVRENDMERARALICLGAMSVLETVQEATDHNLALEFDDHDSPVLEEVTGIWTDISDPLQMKCVMKFLEGYIHGRDDVQTNDPDTNYLRGYRLGSSWE